MVQLIIYTFVNARRRRVRRKHIFMYLATGPNPFIHEIRPWSFVWYILSITEMHYTYNSTIYLFMIVEKYVCAYSNFYFIHIYIIMWTGGVFFSKLFLRDLRVRRVGYIIRGSLSMRKARARTIASDRPESFDELFDLNC